MSVPTPGQGDEEGVSENMQGICSDNRHDSLTILDNVLAEGDLARGE